MRRGEARWLSCACRACRVVNTALRDTRWGLPCVALSLNERQRAHLGEQARRVRSRKRLYIHNIRHSTRQRRRDRSPIFVVTCLAQRKEEEEGATLDEVEQVWRQYAPVLERVQQMLTPQVHGQLLEFFEELVVTHLQANHKSGS